jgi:hypothetical protein
MPPAAPSCTRQVTPPFVVLETVAVNVSVPPADTDVVAGLTATEIGGAVTVMVAVADLDVSATLRAIT